MAFLITWVLRFSKAVTSGSRRSLCMAGFGGIWERASTSSCAASAIRLRREAISSSAIELRSTSPARRRLFVGFLRAASMALSRARRRPGYEFRL